MLFTGLMQVLELLEKKWTLKLLENDDFSLEIDCLINFQGKIIEICEFQGKIIEICEFQGKIIEICEFQGKILEICECLLFTSLTAIKMQKYIRETARKA